MSFILESELIDVRYPHQDNPVWVESVKITQAVQDRAAQMVAEAEATLRGLRSTADVLHAAAGATADPEASWDQNGGRQAYTKELNAETDLYALKMLAAGKQYDGWHGWITPDEACRVLHAECPTKGMITSNLVPKIVEIAETEQTREDVADRCNSCNCVLGTPGCLRQTLKNRSFAATLDDAGNVIQECCEQCAQEHLDDIEDYQQILQ
jgi:hypothetical protein